MDLSLFESNVYNTLLVKSNGVPLYHIKTPLSSNRHPHTVIMKGEESVESGTEDKEMAHIEIHRWHSSTVTVWGRSFLPSKTHLLSSSEAFVASDGKHYQWRWIDRERLELTSTEEGNTSIARYEPERPATQTARLTSASLKVEFEALSILDELVTTFVYMQQKRHKREPSDLSEDEKMLIMDMIPMRPYSSLSPMTGPPQPL